MLIKVFFFLLGIICNHILCVNLHTHFNVEIIRYNEYIILYKINKYYNIYIIIY